MDAFGQQTGKVAGKNYSLIGFDDIEEAGFAAYNLTTIRQDVTGIVQRVMNRLSPVTDGGAQISGTDTVQVCLVERGTVITK